MEMALSKLESEWQLKFDLAKQADALALGQAVEERNKAFQGRLCLTLHIVRTMYCVCA